MRYRLEDNETHRRYAENQAKLKEAELKNLDLQKEIRAMQRIQVEQGKALEKITNENDMPSKLKALTDHLRLEKEKNRELNERVRREERNTIMLQDKMVAYEEKVRELQGLVKAKKGNEEEIYELEPLSLNVDVNNRLQECMRVNAILNRSREVLSKTVIQLKQKMEKLVAKYKSQNEYL